MKHLDKFAANLEIRLALFVVVGVIAYFIIKNVKGPAKDAAGIGTAAAAIAPLL